jgi:hypothetical protein
MIQLVQNARVAVSETIGDETIVINLLDGRYHRLLDDASRLWEALAEPRTLDAWPEAAGLGSGIAPGHLAAFALDLAGADLIELDETASAALADAAGQVEEPSPLPAVESYDDMADLFAIDPVHDVDEHGWPKAAQEA